jgi:hypothetical protein
MNQAHREHLAHLAQTLSAERELLELLLFKLIEARLVLTADEPRFVPQAMLEVESVVDRIRFSEIRRNDAVRGLAAAVGVAPEDLTLRYLAGSAPEPYRTMFEQHRDHFHQLAGEIEQVTLDNRRLASLALRNITDTLGAIIGQPALSVYTASGASRDAVEYRPTRIDEVL